MKIQYRHQKFQANAAKVAVDVFAGRLYLTPTYMMDRAPIILNLLPGTNNVLTLREDF